jgi:hypothetical protein
MPGPQAPGWENAVPPILNNFGRTRNPTKIILAYPGRDDSMSDDTYISLRQALKT